LVLGLFILRATYYVTAILSLNSYIGEISGNVVTAQFCISSR